MSDHLEFKDKSFCFTGTLAELKRTQAEREVRAREGLSSKVVTDYLDYLVVGSIPNPQWKFGDFGSKIKKAKELARRKGKPQIIPESLFMTSLAAVPATDSGAIDTKILVINYAFTLTGDNESVVSPIETLLQRIHDEEGCHVSTSAYPAGLTSTGSDDVQGQHINCRFVKHFALDDDTDKFREMIERELENIPKLDGNLSAFERLEGSGSYIRLLNEIPHSLQIRRL